MRKGEKREGQRDRWTERRKEKKSLQPGLDPPLGPQHFDLILQKFPDVLLCCLVAELVGVKHAHLDAHNLTQQVPGRTRREVSRFQAGNTKTHFVISQPKKRILFITIYPLFLRLRKHWTYKTKLHDHLGIAQLRKKDKKIWNVVKQNKIYIKWFQILTWWNIQTLLDIHKQNKA